MTPETQPNPSPPPEVLKAIDLLAKEYELHRNEILKRVEISNQQNTYIQVFLAALVTVAFAVAQLRYATSDSKLAQLIQDSANGKNSVVTWGVVAVFVVGAGVIWYFISSIAETHYMLNLLRFRMRKVEASINGLLGRDVWTYESSYVPRYITEPFPLGARLNPVVLPVLMRLLFMVTLAFLLLLLAYLLLPFLYRASYTSLFIVYTLYFLASSVKEILPGTRQDLTSPVGTFRLWIGSLGQVVLTLTGVAVILSLNHLTLYFPTVAKLQQWTASLASSFLWSIAFSIIYSTAALIPFAPPAEFPMVLVPARGWTWILASCAIGRGAGALLISYFYTGLDHLLKGRLSQFATSTNWIVTLIRKYSTVGFLTTQGIPFFPMRSGLVGYLVLKKPSRLAVFFYTGIGSAMRNAAMFLGIKYGLIPIYRLFNQ